MIQLEWGLSDSKFLQDYYGKIDVASELETPGMSEITS